MIEKEGIVVRVTQIKERDAMIQIITNDGFFSFLARGVLKVDSKNALFVSLYTHARFELEEGKNGYYSLKGGTLLHSPASSMNDLLYLLTFSSIAELAMKFFDENTVKDYYPYLSAIFMAVYEKSGDPLTLVSIGACTALKLSGYAIQTSGCVTCGTKKDIVSFDMDNGGFFCRKHYDPATMQNQTPSFLKAVRFLFIVPPEEVKNYTLNEQDLIPILNQIHQFMLDFCGVNRKGYELLLRAVRKM